jgi:Zn-dependent M28 family amino/carboxypeptidase
MYHDPPILAPVGDVMRIEVEKIGTFADPVVAAADKRILYSCVPPGAYGIDLNACGTIGFGMLAALAVTVGIPKTDLRIAFMPKCVHGNKTRALSAGWEE